MSVWVTWLIVVLVAVTLGGGFCYLVYRQTLGWLVKSKAKKSDLAKRMKVIVFFQGVLVVIIVVASYVAFVNRHLANQASAQSLGYLLWSIPLLIISFCYLMAAKKYISSS